MLTDQAVCRARIVARDSELLTPGFSCTCHRGIVAEMLDGDGASRLWAEDQDETIGTVVDSGRGPVRHPSAGVLDWSSPCRYICVMHLIHTSIFFFFLRFLFICEVQLFAQTSQTKNCQLVFYAYGRIATGRCCEKVRGVCDVESHAKGFWSSDDAQPMGSSHPTRAQRTEHGSSGLQMMPQQSSYRAPVGSDEPST